jgi:hypothetical protein
MLPRHSFFAALILAFPFILLAQNNSALNGFWEARYSGEGSGKFGDIFGDTGKASLKPDVKPIPRYPAATAAYGAKLPVDGSACRAPQSYPFFMTSSPPFDVVLPADNSGEILVLAEWQQASRHIYMDGRPHAAPINPTRSGDSIGHWDGSSLVIDTIGFAGVTGVPGGGQRGPTTHLVERYTPSADGQKLNVTFTWSDPAIYAEPHTYTLHFYKMPKDTYALGHWCDPGDLIEYTSANGVVVIGNNANEGVKNAPAGGR